MLFPQTNPYQQNIRPGFIGDFLSREHVLPGGIKLDAAAFSNANSINAVVGSAGAAAAATSIPVTALAGPIPSGTVLNFGPAPDVVVTVGSAGAATDATTIPVDALTGPIPSGVTLAFGSKKFATLTAAAAEGATSLTVAAIPTAVVDNDAATYVSTTDRTATLTANAIAGATSLTVSALAVKLVSTDTASYASTTIGKRVAAGTLVGATNAELEGAAATGLQWGPAGDSDDVVYLLAFDVVDVNDKNDADVLRKGTLIKVNNLPDWSTMSSTLKGKVRAAYECTVGAPGQETTPNAANPPA